MALPENWDSAVISVDPGELNTSCTVLIEATININHALSDIITSLNGLKLSWTGESSQVANDFNDRWTTACTTLFGKQGDPSSGVLNVLTSGVAQAAKNYSGNEFGVASMFDKFAAALTQTSGKPGNVTDSVTGNPAVYHTTAVNESGF
ncbi:hypothetical protein K7472_19235 [Streptomyces sp. PTM05]|uniref:WXG100 family type VII secretion target n=1 Tax=Streptantibioticus parmotrematis TaxID=2873249 RepID=A0ABS7QUV4_9ACTN|nr:hypothetical protein [Streptantibioticus parmotrematis]MBY8886974.1 hypothetical protein [Streptantibioticus parmotrematis]